MSSFTMKTGILTASLFAIASSASAAIVFSDNFDTDTGSLSAWTIETPGEAGTATGSNTTPSRSVWMNTGAGGLREAIINKDTGVANSSTSVFTLQYDLIGKGGQLYTGDLLAQIWAGDPQGAGTLLGQAVGTNPAANASITNQLVVNGTGDAGNIYIRFYAQDFDGSDSGQFQQARLDTVSLDQSIIPEPNSLALIGLGGLCVLRRRRS